MCISPLTINLNIHLSDENLLCLQRVVVLNIAYNLSIRSKSCNSISHV